MEGWRWREGAAPAGRCSLRRAKIAGQVEMEEAPRFAATDGDLFAWGASCFIATHRPLWTTGFARGSVHVQIGRTRCSTWDGREGDLGIG